MNMTAMKLAAKVGVAAGAMAVVLGTTAQGATLPNLNWSVAGESSLGFQGTATVSGSSLALTGKYFQGNTSYASDMNLKSTGSFFSDDYTFDLQKGSKVTVSLFGSNLILGATGFAVDAPHGVGGTAVGPSGNGTTASETIGLFKYTGGNLTEVSVAPTGSTAASNHGVDTLTYSNLASGNYVLVVVGSKTTPALGSFSGTVGVQAVPLPGAVLLFGSAVAALGFVGRKIRRGSVSRVG